MTALLGDTPSTFQPFNETLGENRQIWYSGGNPPVRSEQSAARCKKSHVPFQIVKACEAAHQNPDNCDLEVHWWDRSENCKPEKTARDIPPHIGLSLDPKSVHRNQALTSTPFVSPRL